MADVKQNGALAVVRTMTFCVVFGVPREAITAAEQGVLPRPELPGAVVTRAVAA
jgi:chemotaxis response regulator CheB